MKTVSELCIPRDSVSQDSARDDVLNLSDFIENRIDVKNFFSENFKTSGMDSLFETAFNRFKGVNNAAGVIRLTQAMGGGKTHCMLALALLAQYPEYREEFVGFGYEKIGKVRVVAFTGRDCDVPFGIWGSIAEQLGKKKDFEKYYSPLQAPGETAWINLLKGEKTLILLDELPPYLENARSISIGKSDLCEVTITALSNLFSALGKEQLSNVCLVFSDLKATYESGSEQLQSLFKNLEQEANRSAINIEPVAQNTDEIFSILKKRLFEKYPGDNENSDDVREIALGYKEAVEHAKKSGLTNALPEDLFAKVRDSYPFHPAIKDLYARFKENQNFQQTRGLIKLMRQIVRQFYDSGAADTKYLIGVHDFDLNQQNMLSQIKLIKKSLDNAISHDIADKGKSVAESIDRDMKVRDKISYAQDAAKLILMSSLSETPQALLGMTESELIENLVEPGAESNNYKQAISQLSECWYLKTDNSGHIYYQETKNLVAQLNQYVSSYNNDQARKDLRKFLMEKFTPHNKTCYQKVYILPAIDEIEFDMKTPSLVIFEPYSGNDLHPELKKLFNDELYKNRMMFLSGPKNMMENLLNNSKKLTAINQIIADMDANHLSHSDQQYREADARKDKAVQALLESIRQTFITLYYPTKNGLNSEDFKLQFKENSFDGEEQIIQLLIEKMKFNPYSADSDFLIELQDRCENKLFTQKEMQWVQIVERAAVDTSFPWYDTTQFETLKADCIKRDVWREQGGYIVKGPFEKEPTSVSVEEREYNVETGEYTLKVHANYGDIVYYDVGSDPTEASQAVNGSTLITSDPIIKFVCVDSHGEHSTGPIKEFVGDSHLKYQQRTASVGEVMALLVQPKYRIKYTTDGSNPKDEGGEYSGEFPIPANTKFIRVAVYFGDRFISSKDIPVQEPQQKEKLEINRDSPLNFEWKNRRHKISDTESTYNFINQLKSYPNMTLSDVVIAVYDKTDSDRYVELSSNNVQLTPEKLNTLIQALRAEPMDKSDVVVSMEYRRIHFESGAQFYAWTEENKLDLTDLAHDGRIIQ